MKSVKIYTISDIKDLIKKCNNEINKYERYLTRDKDYLEYLKSINNANKRLIRDHEVDIEEWKFKLEELNIILNYLASILLASDNFEKWFMYDNKLHIILDQEKERMIEYLL